jgi:hypothetical protein
MDWNIVASLFDKAIAGVTSLFSWLGKGTLDKTEIAKAELQLKTVIAQLEFSKQQMQIWVQQGLIDLEKSTGAKWRTPLILITGVALVGVCVNNVLAYTYLPSARLISIGSSEVLVLAGLFVLLVTGSIDLLMGVFNGRNKTPSDNNSSASKTEGK